MAWYNGHPDYADHEFDLSATRAVVIGNGNVAVDVARMLVLDPDEMAVTDTADHAIAPLGAASVHEVIVLGRRGPAQAAFTTPELRELGELTRADIIVDPADLELDPFSAQWLEEEGEPTNKRNVELMREYAAREPHGHERRVELRFLRSPLEILGDGQDGAVTGVRIGINKIENGRAVADRRGGDHLLRPGDPVDRLPRHAAGRHPVRRAPRPDLQPRRPRPQPRGRARGRRVRRRLGQARPLGRDRHQQEGRDGHRRPDPRGP